MSKPAKPVSNKDAFDLVLDGLFEILGKIGDFFLKASGKVFKDFYESKFGKKSSNFDKELLRQKAPKMRWHSLGYSLSLNQEVTTKYIDLNKNTIITGGTGSGKNVLMENLIHERLKSGLPVIFIAPKEDHKDLKQFKKLNELYNRKCYVFSEANKNESIQLNPIAEGEVPLILDRIMKAFTWSEQFYKGVAENALNIVLYKLKEKGRDINFQNIGAELHIYCDKLEKKDKQNLTGLINKIDRINSSSFGPLLSSDKSLTLSQVREEGASVYIGISNLGYPEISSQICKLFVQELKFNMYETYRKGNKPNPTSVFIDELGSVVTEDFLQVANQCRGANIFVCVGFQSLSDLDKISPEFKIGLVNNTDNFFIGHTHFPAEAELWASLIGTEEAEKMTYRTEDDVRLADGSIRDVSKFKIHPNIFKKLKTGQFVIRTHKPFFRCDIIQVNWKFQGNTVDKMLSNKKSFSRPRILVAKKLPSRFKNRELFWQEPEPMTLKFEHRPNPLLINNQIKSKTSKGIDAL